MKYRVTLRKRAMKAVERVSEPDFTRLKTAIYALSDNPRPIGYKKLKGREGLRIRVGNYRVIYEVDDDVRVVDVIDLGHRKDVYS